MRVNKVSLLSGILVVASSCPPSIRTGKKAEKLLGSCPGEQETRCSSDDAASRVAAPRVLADYRGRLKVI